MKVVANGTEDYRVQFAKNIHRVPRLEPGTIILAPSANNWNDFGERILLDILISSRDSMRRREDPLQLSGFFGFVSHHDEKADTKPLRDIMDAAPDELMPAEGVPDFFTMLPDMASYRNIVDDLGPDDARLALRAMHDMVEADDRPLGKPWLRAARESPVFLNAFLRNAENYFAWKNAAPILQGVEHEQFRRVSEGIYIRFQLAGRPNEHELGFRFTDTDENLPQRFAVVIGKNGVGKSQTLAHIVEAALAGNTAKLNDGKKGRAVFNRILAFYPSSSGGTVFPGDRRKRARTWYRRFAMVAGRSRQTTSDLIIQLVRSTAGIGARSRFEIFRQAISAIEGDHELSLRTRDRNIEPVPIRVLDRGGEQQKIRRYASIDVRAEPVRVIGGRSYALSSGELSFLRFAALSSLFIENGSLLLLDEPETHLHPNFISQFVALLDDLLEQTGSVAILSTHSVYFVREAFEDQVIVLRSEEERHVVAERPTLKTFGADVGAISYFVFGEDKPSRLARGVEDKIAEDASSWPEVFDRYKDSLSLEVLGDIRARIEGTDREAEEE